MLNHEIDFGSRHPFLRWLSQRLHSPISQRLQPRISRQDILRRPTREQAQLHQILEHNVPSLDSRQALIPGSSQLLISSSKHLINISPSRLPHKTDFAEYPLDDRRPVRNHTRVRQRCPPQYIESFVRAVRPNAQTRDELLAQVVDTHPSGASGCDGGFDAREVVPYVHGHENSSAGCTAY